MGVISDRKKVISRYGYRNLIAWEKSDLLAQKVYEITDSFPKDELFGLTSQLRRSVLSVPANIVEGYSRVSKNEFHRFLGIALGCVSRSWLFSRFFFP